MIILIINTNLQRSGSEFKNNCGSKGTQDKAPEYHSK